MEMVNNSRVYL